MVSHKLTDKERRELFMADRRMALESIRDAIKWSAAALLTLNTGAAVAALNFKAPVAGQQGPIIVLFVLGAAFSLIAAMMAALAGWTAQGRLEVELGLTKPKSPQSARIEKFIFWGSVLMVPVSLGSSFWTLWGGLMEFEKIEHYQYDTGIAALRAQAESARDQQERRAVADAAINSAQHPSRGRH
jgi:hypothetical protein